jgi:hypothetical protein
VQQPGVVAPHDWRGLAASAGRFFGLGYGSRSVLSLRSPVTHPASSPQVEAPRQAPLDRCKFPASLTSTPGQARQFMRATATAP